MSVWLTIPSARPVQEAAEVTMKWRQMGYRVALWRDRPCPVVGLCDWLRVPVNGPYPGYSVAINTLIREIIAEDSTAEWFVCGGDDVLPDPTHPAEEIAAQLRKHFYESVSSFYPPHRPLWAQRNWCPEMLTDAHLRPDCDSWALMGVMQPTGDRFALGQIDRIAGSAWIGREFAKRVYRGKGPLWPEFTHMWVDEHLKSVAEKLGVYLMRPDLVQLHMHWQRESAAIDSNAIHKPETARPPHMHPSLNDGYTREHWKKYEAIYFRLRDAGFVEANDLL